MAFSKITNADFNNRGALSLPDQPTIAAQELKRKFDEDAREVVTPAFNKLVETELPDASAASNIGATAPSPRTGNTIQAVMNSISNDLATLASDAASAIADDHTHSNKAVLDDLSDTSNQLYYKGVRAGTSDYNDLSNKPSINGNTLSGNKTSSDLGLMPATTLATVATSGNYNDLSNKPSIPTVTDTYSGTSSEAMSGKAVKSAIDNITYPINDAYKNIKVTSGGASTTITASSEDEFELEAGSNITLTATGKSIKIDSTGGGGGGGGSYTASKGVVISGSDIEASLAGYTAGSEAAAAYGSTANRTYAVGLDSNNKLAVNIPLSAAALSGSYADLSNKPTIPTVSNTYSSSSTDAMSGQAVADALGTLDVADTPVAGQYVSAVSETDGKISVTRGTLPTGHTMLPDPTSSPDEDDVVNAIKGGLLEGGTNDDVASLYGIGTWSNCEAKLILTTAAQGDTQIGVWNDAWKTDNIRTGWLWSADLYQILEDGSGNKNYNIEVIPTQDIGEEEVVSVYAYRIDDDVTYNGQHGGAVAIKFNGEIQSASGVKVGVKLVHQRTEVNDTGTILS